MILYQDEWDQNKNQDGKDYAGKCYSWVVINVQSNKYEGRKVKSIIFISISDCKIKTMLDVFIAVFF